MNQELFEIGGVFVLLLLKEKNTHTRKKERGEGSPRKLAGRKGPTSVGELSFVIVEINLGRGREDWREHRGRQCKKQA